MSNITSYADKEYTVFLVRPWHSPQSSLYPHTMDGVEYINEAIHVIKRYLGPEGFEVRVDEDVFIPGLTLRENLHREIFDADLVLVLLDGLRPNVIYELGFAYGWHQFRQKASISADGGGETQVPSIVCFAEKHATVLVRNLYPNPLSVPTLSGDTATILNPRLDLCKMFSDNSDLLVSYYDRLNLIGSLEGELRRLVGVIRGAKSKQTIVRDASPEKPSQEEQEQDWWKLYEQSKYVDVVNQLQNPKTFSQRKVLALSLMKLGRLYESIAIWNQLLDDADQTNTAGILLHLGICYYAVGELSTATNFFRQSHSAGDQRANSYLERIRRRTQGRVSTEASSATGDAAQPQQDKQQQ